MRIKVTIISHGRKLRKSFRLCNQKSLQKPDKGEKKKREERWEVKKRGRERRTSVRQPEITAKTRPRKRKRNEC